MRTWWAIVLLLALAAAAAFGWHLVAADPGYVLLRIRGISVETSLVFALAALLVAWALLSFGWRLLRWPVRAWGRAQRRRGRERLGSGLVAFAEGNHARAQRDLAKASRQPALRGPALLAQARAAHVRGEDERAFSVLEEASSLVPAAALAMRARFLLETGDAAQALSLLKPRPGAADLVPAGWRVLIDAALVEGDVDTALEALPPLARSQSLAAAHMTALETRVLAAALTAAPGSTRLNALWSGTTRGQRRTPALITAFARRASSLGLTLAAMDEIESALRREWNDELALCYGELGSAELATRTRHAEAWLARAPDSPAVLTTLGRLCREQGLWGKGIEYLQHALARHDSVAAWQALGDCQLGIGDEHAAVGSYINALRLKGELSTAAIDAHGLSNLDTQALTFEERDQHGVPRLPALPPDSPF